MNKTLQTIKKAGILYAFFGVSLMSAQLSYTFTNAGATGPVGPTAPQITAAYLATNLNGSVTVSGGIQSFTVPITGPYQIKCYGAQGGGVGNPGGLGAFIQSDMAMLSAGGVLNIMVGQQGNSSGNAGGGGGGSGVYVGVSPLIVAGGGGGGTSISPETGYPGLVTTSGGNSSGLGGIGGLGGHSGFKAGDCGYAGGGGGWSQSGFGSNIGDGIGATSGGPGGGLSAQAGGTGGSAGGCGNLAFGQGGFGFGGGGHGSYGGGGGGGYSGGGGGQYVDVAGKHSGGGGGSYSIGPIITSGLNSGMGKVIISSLFFVNISQTATISCSSYSTAALSTTVSGGISPYTYTWMPTGGNAATASALAAGVYTCFVNDGTLFLTSSTFTVTQPTAVIASVASQSNVTCYGSNNGAITLNTTTGGTAPYSYTWSPTGGNTVTATGLVANVYSCIVKDANNCSASSAPTATITQPAAFINASSSNSVICAGETATLTATGATSYTWSTGATSPAIVISPSVTTTYTVTGLLAGCTNSLTGTQTVNACTGINEVTASLISVYPNPNNGIVNITLTTALAQNSTLEIYDTLCKLVVKQVLAKELNAVNMSNLDNGIYVFKVLNNNNTVKIGKLIKQ